MAETTFTSRNRAQCERPQRRVSSQTEELTEMFSLLTFSPIRTDGSTDERSDGPVARISDSQKIGLGFLNMTVSV